MADNGTAQSASTQAWPLPSFYFKVSISNVGDISCSEVSGLETEFEEITYRAGDSPVFTKLRMPLTCWKKISRSKSMESLEDGTMSFSPYYSKVLSHYQNSMELKF